jgi:3-dehydroquinate synthase
MRTVRVELGPRAYAISIGAGTRRLLEAWSQSPRGRQIVVLADQAVADLHLSRLSESLPKSALALTFPSGETSKSLCVAEPLFERLAQARIERGAAIVAFGGGVAGDLAGFIAGTWLRGISFVQVPTSLLAAVDASVGGKTGVNLAAGKNLVGVFHQPEAVLIDTDFFGTLPEREYRAGLAESVKHAVIRDPEFLAVHRDQAEAILGRKAEVLTELIARNCAIKADVVSRDERETDLRAILNHGHTIGHAVEHLLAYELRHGECVALGMRVENEIARRRGWLSAADATEIARALTGLGLPERLPRPLDEQAILAACRLDKKVRHGAVHFVLLAGLGTPRRAADVTDDEILTALTVVAP